MNRGARPNVLFVSHTSEWTGPTHSLLLMLERLAGRIDGTVLLPGEGAFHGRLAASDIPRISFASLHKFAIPAMIGLFRRGGFDLVYGNNTSGASKNALIAAKMSGLPFIYHIRAMAGTRSWRKVGFLRFADAAVAVSEACARSYRDYLRPPLPYVVHNGVPEPTTSFPRDEARAHLERLAGAGARDVVILSVGNVDARKAPHYAVRALARVAPSLPETRLVLVGRLNREPGYTERIRRLVRELGLEDRVTLTGFREDVPRLLAGADLLLHTAVEDPHPRAVIEAMAAGLPVVAFAADGVAETVEEGVTGRLIRPGDVDALAGALHDLARDASRRQTLGERGRQRARDRFSADATARAVGDVIEQTLGRRRRDPGHGRGRGRPPRARTSLEARRP